MSHGRSSPLKKYTTLFITAIVLSLYGVFVVFAAAPNGGYTPGGTLDPDCAPGDTDCVVAINTGGSSQWDDVVGGINYAGGNVGIGTTTPSATLDVIGMIQGSNLNIVGDGITTAAPTNISASFIYDNGGSYNYSAYNYNHNYRVYSYKDTGQGRVYSSSYLTLPSPSDPAPAAPTNLAANQTCDADCNYYADGSVVHNFRVYSYKLINNQRIYSASYGTLGSDFTDDNSSSGYDVTVSWDPVSGADGYRVLKYDQGYNGFNYDAGYDTANTSIIDDGCGSVCYDNNRSSIINTNDIYDNGSTDYYGIDVSWDPVSGADGYRVLKYDPNYNGYNYDAGYDTTATSFIDDGCNTICFNGGTSSTNVGQTSVYTNVATINGQLTLTGPIVLNGTTLAVYGSNLGWNTAISSLNGENNIFLGSNSGLNVTDVYNSNFFGYTAGQNATNASQSNFFGYQAGSGATNAGTANFFGSSAGQDATDAYNSNFFGANAGQNASAANTANFFGPSAGYGATNAFHSNFFGCNAGYQATGAYRSNFFGCDAGSNATNANNSNFFGGGAGYQATNAANSNFFGNSAGYGATNAANSNFFGYYAGQGATDAVKSTFIGEYAGASATNAWSSVFVGDSAGRNSSEANRSNFFGSAAGWNATNAQLSNFFGGAAGMGATDAENSNFFGYSSGLSAINASNSNFFGNAAGYNATNAANSNFFGLAAGQYATDASSSNFFGYQAGYSATSATNANFFGQSAGMNAVNASYSNFFGAFAGGSAMNASNSIFIGRQAGFSDSVDNTGNIDDFSILIGKSTSTGGYSNSIAIGGSATNTASNQFMIGSLTRPIDEIRVVQTGGTECIIDTSGLGCTSDERLKTNITDLTNDTLDKVLDIKTVTYNWLNNPEGKTMTGFLAQDLEQYFPELVATNERGQKSVYYAQITPILVEAIREMNLKITDISNMETPNTWRDALIAWFGNTANGITDLFTKRIHTDELCVGTVCVTQDQFLQMVNNSGSVISGNSNPAVTPDPEIIPDTGNDNPSDEPVITDTNTGDNSSDNSTDSGDSSTE